MKKYDIFISSKSEDYSLSEGVCDFLEANGLKVFIASRELQKIGEAQYAKAIDEVLDNSAHMIVVASSLENIKSKWVEYEWSLFSNDLKSGYREGNLITILSDAVELKTLPGSLRHQQSFNLNTYKNHILDYLRVDSSEEGHNSPNQETIIFSNGDRYVGEVRNGYPHYWWQKAAEQGHEAAILFINSKERHKLSEPQKSKIIPINGIEFKMIKVDGGTFEMGSIDGCADEQPIHQVTLSDYYIAETLVTQEIWNSVMGSNPSNFKNAKSPVENVSWDDCQTFIEKLNSTTGNCFRLPTEAEWEYAARGGQFSNGYIYSGSNNIEEVAWWWENSNKTTHPVKSKKPNELGIYDMSGNVWEWCEDDNSKYQPESVMDPLIQDNSSSKIERGGCWDDNWGDAAKSCRVSYRSSDWKTYSSKRIGFRLAMSTAARIKDQEQATKEFPQTIKIPFDDKSFNMLLSADKSYYIGCVTDTKNEYKWLKSNSSIKISHVAIAVSTIIFPIPALIAFLSYCFFSSDDKERDKTQFIVNENLCNRISNDIKFAVPQTHELKDVKEEEKKYCIVIRISDNPKLHDFLTVTNAKN